MPVSIDSQKVIFIDIQRDFISRVFDDGRVSITLFQKGAGLSEDWHITLGIEKTRRDFPIAREIFDREKGEAWGRLNPDDLIVVRKFYALRDKMVKLLSDLPLRSAMDHH